MVFSGLFQDKFIDQVQVVAYFHEWEASEVRSARTHAYTLVCSFHGGCAGVALAQELNHACTRLFIYDIYMIFIMIYMLHGEYIYRSALCLPSSAPP